MTFAYPTPTTIDVFYTNAEGSLVTPEKLSFGKGYSIVEVQAPYGYAKLTKLRDIPLGLIAASLTAQHSPRRGALMTSTLSYKEETKIVSSSFALSGVIMAAVSLRR